MASFLCVKSTDMHNTPDDDLFSQLLQFKSDPYQNEVLFDDSSPVQRAHLESSAYMLGLEYEYSSISKRVRILRPKEEPAEEFEEQDEYDDGDSVQGDMTQLQIEGMNSNDQPSDTRADIWIPQATPDGKLFYFNTETGETSMELPSEFDPGDEFLNFDPPTTIEGNGELDNVLNPPNDPIFDCAGHTTMYHCDWAKELSHFSFEPGINEMPNPVSSGREAHWNDFDMNLDKINNLDNLDAGLFEESSIGHRIQATDMEKWKRSPPPSLTSSAACLMEENFREDWRIPSGFGILTSLPSKAGIQDANEGATNVRTSSNPPNNWVGSRSSSISSQTSERGRNRIQKAFSRRSSIQSNAGHGFKEIIFDSRSNHSVSSSAGSFQSFSSVRSGRLSGVARNMMRAVKEIGACWRCKILRKVCNTETPCKSCPHGNHNSAWRALGCKRGNLKDQLPRILLCPGIDLQYSRYPSVSWTSLCSRPFEPWKVVNNHLERLIATRNEKRLKWISERTSNTDTKEDGIREFLDSWKTDTPETGDIPSTPPAEYVALKPLQECVYDIAWEVSIHRSPQWIITTPLLGGIGETRNLELLRSASLYQASHDGDRLIAISLICLRACLEALDMKQMFGWKGIHKSCEGIQCRLDCINNIHMHLNTYSEALSTVIFKKENMRSKFWWLSAFYSLIIQSMVRIGLLELTTRTGIYAESEYLSKISAIKILKEQVDWHKEEKYTLEQEKDTRQRVGLFLAERDQKWLDNYPNTISLLLQRLKDAKEEVRTLRAQYYDWYSADEEGNPTDFEERYNFICNFGSSCRRAKAIQQYMYLGVRLFIASSGIHDPLMKDYSACPASSAKEEKTNEKYQAAQMAVRRDSWERHGILSSGDFLKIIFEDRAEPLEEVTNKDSHFPFGGYKVDLTACYEFLAGLSSDDLQASAEVGPNDSTSLPPEAGVERQPGETIQASDISMSALTNLADDFGNVRS